MPLSWNEIRTRAVAFSKEFEHESSEDAEAKTFWDAFFNVFGISRRRIASFEVPTKKSDGKGGFIDLLWKGTLLVEHKSRGKDLNRAFHQATDYFYGLKDRDLPRYVLVSDFARFRLYDLETNQQQEFVLKELHKNIKQFGFVAGYQAHRFEEHEEAANIKAAEQLGKLHDQLKATGYDGHPLEVLLVRLLFCLFADDTGIFEKNQFRDYLEQRTSEDGADLGMHLEQFFQVLNTPSDKRLKTLDEELAAFTYVNGRLFAETFRTAAFNATMRETLLDACGLEWGAISPAIFGSLFQSIMDKEARRNLGAHYTREVNILKALRPLFLDALRAELGSLGRSSKRLLEFQKKLASIKILDPACGCGNFLVIAYRELRLLELQVLHELYVAGLSSKALDVKSLVFVDVDQFYGIEIEEFPAQIAQVALWLTDHQMNQRVSDEFGQYFARLPLVKSPNIIHANALRVDWQNIIAPDQLSFIVGNPPFVGKQLQSDSQKEELLVIFNGVQGAGVLDYVAAWYRKSVEYMSANKEIRAALVSTNSITQGEQVSVLWPQLIGRGLRIHFAHRTFQWSSEARGKAAVHCVIIGFGLKEAAEKWIFEYETPKSEPHAIKASHINPYLVDAADIFLEKRLTPLCSVPSISFGSMANDGGHLLLSDEEKKALLDAEPGAWKWIRPFMQVDELLYGKTRWCLWLLNISPAELSKLPLVSARVRAVKNERQKSKRPTTQCLADFPTLFGENRQPSNDYFVVPRHTGIDRTVIPIAKVGANVICGDANLLIADPSPFVFGIVQSTMHMAWVRSVCGRIKSDYRYSASIVFNNFPWPEATDKQRRAIEIAAQEVLDARAVFSDSSLADLYDPLKMPPALVKAHLSLDRAVDSAYGKSNFKSEAERVAFLFALYQQITAPLDVRAPKNKKRGKTKS